MKWPESVSILGFFLLVGFVLSQFASCVKEEKARSVILKEGATVEELVRALTLIGSTPRDVVAILQSLRASGALEAELEVI